MRHSGSAVLLIAVMVAFWLGCAEVAAPPGGEEDKTGPRLIGSEPPGGAIAVPAGNRITLHFSEDITQPSRDKAVFITPRPTEAPDIKWKRRRIEITLPEPFEPNRTYVVSVAAGLTDLRGNKVDSSMAIAFSTGQVLDSGRTAGFVVDEKGKARSGVLVGLFELGRLEFGFDWDTLYADYLVQTTKDGWFEFGYLPDRRYRLIAWDDRNRNELPNLTREAFALTDREVVVGGAASLDSLRLQLVSADTSGVEMLACAVTPDGAVRVRLSREVDLRPLIAQPDRLVLTSFADSTRRFLGAAVIESDLEKASTFHIWAGDIAHGDYMVVMRYDSTRAAAVFSRLSVSEVEDRQRPKVRWFHPDKKPQFVAGLTLDVHFSEPMDTGQVTDKTFALLEKPVNRRELTREWLSPLHLRLTPDSLRPGASYVLEMTQFELSDLAGNRVGDSLSEYTFSTINEDSLGWASGAVRVLIPGKGQDPVVLTFEEIRTDLRFDLTADSGQFTVALPAGKYLVTGFVDSDRDGSRGIGSLRPFRLAETQVAFADTVAVRPRFETADVQLTIR